MNIKIKTPFVWRAIDYHEFESLVDTFETLGDWVISFVEINWELFQDGYYRAVFFVDDKEATHNKKFFSNLEKELKDDFKKENGYEFEDIIFYE